MNTTVLIRVIGLTSGALAMAARPTVFNGQPIEPVATFSSRWETNLRPGFPPSRPIARLKDLHLATPLVDAAGPTCVLVIPAARYADAASRVRAAIETRTGVRPPLLPITTCSDPESLFADRHLVVFGNMATNPLIFRLYCRWLTLLDLRWPGSGGHALLSLHNPFGTGRNAILVGGSDDAGVMESADRLAARIERGEPLGWLHDVGLGKGLIPPDLATDDPVRWWAGAPGQKATLAEMKRAACFGWNSIATCACLYYMTGDEEYARQFKRLAMSRPGRVPDEIRQDYSYWNPANPLVETYHYYSHLIPCLWDLIEESPVFSDDERVYITNKLVEQQDHFDPGDDFGTPNGSRHCGYQMLNIYTGSRYLATYYPECRWFQRLANIRAAFAAWQGNCTWGELDLVPWLPTSEEFVFSFFLLDDAWEAFVDDGSAAELIAPQLHCWTGTPVDPVNRQQALSMMHQATWITRDPGWAWLARQAGYEQEGFLVGQSWWPSPDLAPRPPEWALGRVSVVPLQRSYWQAAHRTIPLEQGAQFAVYRDSLDDTGDYLRLDMAWFCERNPYHLATPDALRIGGVRLLDGFGANASVRRDGLMETGRTPQMAALLGRPALAEGAAIVASVPNASHGAWARVLLHRSGRRTVVVDQIAPRGPGEFELNVAWPLRGGLSRQETAGAAVVTRVGQAELFTVGADRVVGSPGEIHATTVRSVLAGDRIVQTSLLRPVPRQRGSQLRSASDHLYVLDDEVCILSGSSALDGMSFAGTAAAIEPALVCMAGVTEFALGETAIRAERPVSLVWAPARGAASATVAEATSLHVNGETYALAVGTHEFELADGRGLATQLRAFLQQHGRKPEIAASGRKESPVFHKVEWRDSPSGPVLHLGTPKSFVDTGCALDTARPFALEAWVNPEHPTEPITTKAQQAIVAQWQVTGDQRGFMLLLQNGVPAFWASPDGKWGNVTVHAAAAPLAPGWHHLGMSWDGESVTIFVDGLPVGGGPLATIHRSQAAILLGRYDSGYPFRGDLRGVRIHGRALSPAAFAAYRTTPADAPPPLFSLVPPTTTPAAHAPRADWVPAWRCQLRGAPQFLAVSPRTDTIWAACADSLIVVGQDGAIRRAVPLPAPITALAMAPPHPAVGELAAVVGLDDDRLFALDRDGNALWQEKAEIHPKYWLDGHWRAPWFTDPATCHGVLDILFMDWGNGSPPEIVLGRACTVEFRALDGTLVARLPLDWGDRATLGIGRSATGDPLVTAANLGRSLGANIQAIDPTHRNLGSRYLDVPAGYTRIPGHGQGFRFPHLADLDGDGQEEYLCALAGSWNDLACYAARSGKPKWIRAFGAGPRDGSFLAGLAVTAADKGNGREIVAAARDGWLWRFDGAGKRLAATRLPTNCADLAVTPAGVVVGLDDGSVRRLDANDECVRCAFLGEPVRRLALCDGGILASTAGGTLFRLPADADPGADR